MTGLRRNACPVCGSTDLEPGPTVDGVPAHAVRLCASAADAVAEPRGDISLAFCTRCGLVANVAFDPALVSYGPDYESTQTHSPTYRSYVDEMIAGLLECIEGDGAVVDVGCGQGEFLAAFAATTSHPLIGFDPALDVNRAEVSGATLHATRFDPTAVDGDVSLITCKMTLEHVADPVALLRDLAEVAARSDAPVFVQVPNCSHIFGQVLVSDVIYEHVNYFTAASIAAACAHAGLTVVESTVTYGDQHLGVIARAGCTVPPSHASAGELAAFRRFGASMGDRVAQFRHAFLGLVRDDRTPVLWGAGSKAVALLALTGLESDVPFAVDINPLKQGTFLPGSGIEIVAPGDPRLGGATDVFVMNPIYAGEIETSLRAHGHTAHLHLVD